MILPCKSYYIDKLFKDRFLDFSIEPVSKSNMFFDSVNWDTVTLPKIKPSFGISKVNYWLIGALGGIVITIFVFYINRSNSNIPVVPEIDSVTTDNPNNTLISPINTFDTVTKIDTFAIKGNSVNEG